MSVPRTARMSGISASSFRAAAFEVGEFSLPPIAREDRADTVLELAVVGRRHGVTTLDRLLPDVRLDEPEMLLHPPRDLREDIRGALVAGLVGLIDGVTGTLTIGGQRGRERIDVGPLFSATFGNGAWTSLVG